MVARHPRGGILTPMVRLARKGSVMAVMSQEVKDLFEKVPTVVFATSSLEGQPNADDDVAKT